jgi:HPt (histidine-containing phosphotransfer) domain-containing protein
MNTLADFHTDIAAPSPQPPPGEAVPGPHWSLPADVRDLESTSSDILPCLINLFINDADKRIAALTDAAAAQDFSRMRAQAHAMKGASIQMGAAPLAFFCAALEQGARDQRSHCGLLVEGVTGEYQHVRREMETYVSRG